MFLLQKDLVAPLTPQLKGEKRDGSSASDPYVAFRRRTEKMQTRKVSLVFLILRDVLLTVFEINVTTAMVVLKLCVELVPNCQPLCRIVRMTRLPMRRCSNFEET